MKNTNSKSLRQYQNNPNKRSMSPLITQPPQVAANSKSSKKKTIQNSPYQKAMKEFDSYGKAERKKTNQGREIESSAKHNKFRIVTEPVDDRIMHLAQSNIFNSSLALRNPNSRKKIETEVHESTRQIRLNVRDTSKSRSRERIFSNANNRIEEKCRNCSHYEEELEYLNAQIKRLTKSKRLWQQGDLTLDEIIESFRGQVPSRGIKREDYKMADSLLQQIRGHFCEMMRNIEDLSQVDYPKMLSMNIFSHDHTYSQYSDPQEAELKDLFGQLRATVEGKIIDYDTYDSQSENTYTKMIMRNLKCRLGSSLRENLELRIRKQILEKAEQISEQSEGYLRKVIEEVLESYSGPR